jgi:hypothetical protein
MKPVSMNTLIACIEAMVVERELLLRRSNAVPLDIDNEESLSERVLWIDEAIGELREHYETARTGESSSFPHVSDFLAECDHQVDLLLGPGEPDGPSSA